MEHVESIPRKKLPIIYYIEITKPGIVLGNLVAVIGGFFLASKSSLDVMLLLNTLLGVTFVIASGCAFNNVIDRDIDQRMSRTQSRVLANGLMSINMSLAYASVLGIVGLFLLYFKTNAIAAAVALAGFIIYVGVYSLYMKRHSVHATLVGSLAGAVPPVIGYCAVSQEFDAGAALLLLVFSLWQMPHAFAISIFRLNDYRAAAIPVLPALRGVNATKKQIVFYIVAFILSNSLLSLTGYTGQWYLLVTSLISCYWLQLAKSGFAINDYDGCEKWARKIFRFSIIIVIALSVMMAVDGIQ